MYLLFAGYTCYPLGGWDDFMGEFATLEEAQLARLDVGEYGYAWWHVVHDGKIVDDYTHYK